MYMGVFVGLFCIIPHSVLGLYLAQCSEIFPDCFGNYEVPGFELGSFAYKSCPLGYPPGHSFTLTIHPFFHIATSMKSPDVHVALHRYNFLMCIEHIFFYH